MPATKTYKRRDRGQGGLYEYATKSGEKRWYIKFSAARPGEADAKAYVRRQGREWGPRPKRPFLTRRDALSELDEIRAELKAGTYFTKLDELNAPPTPTEVVTVGSWLDKWLAARRIAPSTRASYAKNIRVHLKNPTYGIGFMTGCSSSSRAAPSGVDGSASARCRRAAVTPA